MGSSPKKANVPSQFEQDQIVPRSAVSKIMDPAGKRVAVVVFSIDVRVYRMPAIEEIRCSTQGTRLMRGPLVDASPVVQMTTRQLAYVFWGGIRVQRAQADTACAVAGIQDAFLSQGMGGIGQQHPNFSISC